jgi:phosphatidate cytidylyltransferase
MTWRTAFADPIFRRYVIIILSGLAGSGVLLAAITLGLRKNVGKVWTIWRSWIVMAPLGLLVVALGREATIVGVTLLAVFGFKEFARATGLYRDWWMTGAVYLALLATAAAAWLPDPTRGWGRPGWWGLMQAMPIYATALIVAIPILRNRVQGQLQAVSLAVVGFLLVGWMLMHLAFLTNSAHACGYLIFIIFACEVCDISAYTFGKLLGHFPLRSNVSPRKTWGGALGALAIAMALPWLLSFSFPACFDWRAKVAAGLIVGVGGPLGDLAISVFKRDLGLKDMGAAIPGHGGILDRLDSLLLTAPLFTRLVNLVDPF